MTTQIWASFAPSKHKITKIFQYISYISLNLSKLNPPDTFSAMGASFLLNIFQNILGWGRYSHIENINWKY